MVNASPSSSRALTTASGYSRRSCCWSSSVDRAPSATSFSANATKGVSSRGLTTMVVDMRRSLVAGRVQSPVHHGRGCRTVSTDGHRSRPGFQSRYAGSACRVTLVAGLCLRLELAALDRLLGRAQVTQLDQG